MALPPAAERFLAIAIRGASYQVRPFPTASTAIAWGLTLQLEQMTEVYVLDRWDGSIVERTRFGTDARENG